MTFTRGQLHGLLANLRRAGNPAAADAKARELAAVPTVAALDGRGGVAAFHRIDRTNLGGFRSKTESVYAARLELQRHAGEILGWDYETDRLKLADPAAGGEDRTRESWFKTDFTVYHVGGLVSWDECKGGYMTEAGRLRFRWLCERYKFRWLRLWRYERGVWTLAVEGGRPEGATT